MSNDEHDTKKAPEERPDPGSSRWAEGGRGPMGFDCRGTRMREMMAACPCGPIMRRHPVVMVTILAVMALAMILIPVGAILGMIAFLMTI